MIRTFLSELGSGNADEPPYLWVSQLSRGLLDSGEFVDLVSRGVTGADIPAVAFAHSLLRRVDIAEDVNSLDAAGMDCISIRETLLAEDVCDAADELRSIHEDTFGATGFVSTDGPWILATSAGELVNLAERFTRRLSRPNVMLNLPATRTSMHALGALFQADVSVNITAVGSIERLQDVWDAWLSAASLMPACRAPPSMSINVAPFRVGGVVDRRIGELEGLPVWAPAWRLVGRAAHALAWTVQTQHRARCDAALRLFPDLPVHAVPQLHWHYDSADCGCEDALQCLKELPLAQSTLLLPQLMLFRWLRGRGPCTQPVDSDTFFERDLSALGISMGQLTSEIEAQAVVECSDGERLLDRSIASLCSRA